MQAQRQYTKPMIKALQLCLLVVFWLGLSGCSGGEKTAVEHLALAKQAATQGNAQTLEIELKNALQIDPELAEARLLLGQHYLKQYKGRQAQKELQKALELGIPATDAGPDLLRAYYYQNDFDGLLEASKVLVYEDAFARALDAYYRALSYLGKGQLFEALESFEESAKAAPETVHGLMSVAYIHYLSADYPAAEKEVEELLRNHADVAEVQVLASRLYGKQGKFDAAIVAIEEAKSLQPQRLQLLTDSARLYLQARDIEAADRDISQVLAEVKGHVPSLVIKATIEMSRANWQEVKKYADDVLARSSTNQDAKLLAGIANFQLHNWEQAYKHLNSVKDKLPKEHQAHRMLALTSMTLGYSKDADDILKDMGSLGEKDSSLLTIFGAEFARSGKVDEARELYEKAAILDVSDPNSITKLAMLKLQEGDDSGLQDLEAALRRDPAFAWARAALTDHYLKTEQPDKARQQVEALLELAPSDITSYMLAFDTYIRLDQVQKAYDLFMGVKDRFGDAPAIYFGLATVDAKQGRPEMSVQHMQSLVTTHPDYLRGWLYLYRYSKLVSATAVAEAEKTIAAAQASHPDSANINLAKAMIDADQGRHQRALKELSKVQPDSPLYARSQRLAGDLNLKLDHKEKALQYYQKWMQIETDNERAYLTVYQLLKVLGNNREALDVVQAGLQKKPNSQLLALTEIHHLLDNNGHDQAQAAIKGYSDKHGENETLLRMQGEYYANQNELEKALVFYQRSYEINPSQRTTLGLAQLYARSGDPHKAQALVEEWLAAYPEDNLVRFYRAELSARQGDDQAKQDVLKQYQVLVENAPDNYVSQNNMAWALIDLGRYAESEVHAEKAYQLKKDSPRVMDTYGYALLLNGKLEMAAELLDKANRAQPENPNIAYHYALLLSEQGRADDARALLKPLMMQSFKEKSQAETLLEKLQ